MIPLARVLLRSGVGGVGGGGAVGGSDVNK